MSAVYMWERHEYDVVDEPMLFLRPDAAGRVYLIKPRSLTIMRQAFGRGMGSWDAYISGPVQRQDGKESRRGWSSSRSERYDGPDFEGAPPWVIAALGERGLL